MSNDVTTNNTPNNTNKENKTMDAFDKNNTDMSNFSILNEDGNLTITFHQEFVNDLPELHAVIYSYGS